MIIQLACFLSSVVRVRRMLLSETDWSITSSLFPLTAGLLTFEFHYFPNRKDTTMPSIKTRSGIELYLKDWGVGRPLVLIHGWPLSADSWDDIAVPLANAGFRTIAYDRRGFGRSSQPWDGYNYDTLSDDLADVIATLRLSDVTLIGFSMGGGSVCVAIPLSRTPKRCPVGSSPNRTIRLHKNPSRRWACPNAGIFRIVLKARFEERR